jgi:PAS domain-containing protein
MARTVCCWALRLGGGAGGAVACSPTVVGSLPCGVAGSVAGALKGAAMGAATGAAVDASIMFAKKGDIKQVDQAVRKALGRKPTDAERGGFRDHIHSVKKDGQGDFSFKDLLNLAKDFFGAD